MKPLFFAIAGSFLVSCQMAEHPKLCVVDARTYDPAAPACTSKTLTRAEEGLTIYVVHALPSKVEPPGPVRLRVETACGSEEREVAYAAVDNDDQNVAVASFKAPKGASCGLIVTATVADQTQRQVVAGTCTASCEADAAVSDAADDTGDPATDSHSTSADAGGDG